MIKPTIQAGYPIPREVREGTQTNVNNSSQAGQIPHEILLGLFQFLSPINQAATTSVCKHWQVVGEHASLKMVREFCFGKAKWAKYFGDIGIEPPLPKNIHQILSAPCIFWPGKKVRDTHLLVLVPGTVNGNPFHLNSLSKLLQSPKTGHKTKYDSYNDFVKKELGTSSEPSHWVLMTKDLIPNSRNKAYDEQKALVATHAQKSGIPYTLPKALDVTTAILMHYVETGEHLYTPNKTGTQWIFTRCQEKVDGNKYPVTIGFFSGGDLSLRVFQYITVAEYLGVGAAQKF